MAGKVKSLVFSDGVTTTAPTLSAGSGEINLISNPSDADSGWAASGSGVTVATTTTAGELPLAGVVDSAIKVTCVSGTHYAYYRWTMPAALKNKKLKVEWYQRTVGAYATGDLKVEVYKNSASNYSGSYTEFALSTDASGTSSIPAANGKYTTYFDADSGDYYELRVVRVAGTAALSLAQVIVGPGIQPQGAVVTEWQSYTPTVTGYGTGGAASGYPKGWWRRVGDSAQIHIAVKKDASAGTGAATISFSLPASMTADSSKLSAVASPYPSIGTAGSDVAYEAAWQVRLSSTTTVFLANVTEGIFEGGDWAANETIWLNFSVPIAEWSGSGTLNVAQNDVEYAWNSSSSTTDDTSSFSYGQVGAQIRSFAPAGTAHVTKRVQFQTPIQASDAIVVEISGDAGATWSALGATQFAFESNDAGTTLYGAYGTPVTATTYDVRFQSKGNKVAAWSAFDSALYRWRVRKVSGGAAVGFGIADTNSSGLVSTTTQSFAGIKNNASMPVALAKVSVGKVYNGNGTFLDADWSETAGFAFDQGGIFTPGTTDAGSPSTLGIFTVPSGAGGVYLLSAEALWTGANLIAGGRYLMRVYKNATANLLMDVDAYCAAAGRYVTIGKSRPVQLASGDKLWARIYSDQNHSASTVTLSDETYISLTKLY